MSTTEREERRAFWRGFGRGLGQSLSSPENAARVRNSSRISFRASLIGSLLALSWARHVKAVSGEPFTTSDQFAVVVTGAVGATTIVLLCRWLWKRWNDAPTA